MTSYTEIFYISKENYDELSKDTIGTAARIPVLFLIVNVQVQTKYDTIYTLYQLTAINNETKSTGIHALRITATRSSTTMPDILYMYVPMYCHRSVHINTTLLGIQLKNKTMHLLFTILSPYKYQQQICPSTAPTCASY